MKPTLLASLVAGALAVGHAATTHASCSLAGWDIHQVTYWSAGAGHDHADERCDYLGSCALHGWVVAPASGSKLKAVVMAHGSQGQNSFDEQSLDEYCELTNRLVTNGYVVFWPFRRGVYDVTSVAMVGSGAGHPIGREAPGRFDGDTRGGYFANTGWAATDWAAVMATPGTDANIGYYVSYVNDEATQDMNDAINFIAGYKRDGANLVDRNHIAVGGHSIGGAVAGLASAAHFDIQPKAFVSLSGAAMSWSGSHWWRDYLEPAAASHTAIVFYDRVLNEDPATPPTFASSNVQFNAATGFNGGAVRANYPAIAIPNSDCPASVNTDALHYWCVHSNFVTKPQWVNLWFPDLLQFLTNHL